MKIKFLLNSAFPTQKAYGKTTYYSALAATELGHDVEVWAPKSDIPFPGRISFRDTSPSEPIFIKKFSRLRILRFDKVWFQLRDWIFPLQVLIGNRSALRNSNLWVRDVPLAFWARILLRENQIVLEIHHPPKKINTLAFRMIANNQKVIISTLTQDSASRLKEKYSIGNSVIVSPMAAPREFFSKSVTNASKVVTVGYLGKFTSSGRSNGIENLIKELKIAADSMPNLRFLFIGIEREYRQVIESLVDSSQLKEKLNLIDHVEGDELFDALKEINIGLVPYPEDVYHANRFPIKIVEYAALRATILATDTKAHREILGDDLGYFYDSTIKGSLARRLKEMLIEPELMNEKRTNARTWAETHTYLSRVQIVIHELVERFRVS